MESDHYQIEEVADRTGLTPRMLRYYEEIGILAPLRKESGYRLYSKDDIEILIRLREIKDKLGFPMSDLKAFSGIQKQIIAVLKGELHDTVSIQSCKNETERLLRLVEEKEEVLSRLKRRLNSALKRLNSLPNEK
jgi:DNA-binding transcriptional MerR regulator